MPTRVETALRTIYIKACEMRLRVEVRFYQECEDYGYAVDVGCSIVAQFIRRMESATDFRHPRYQQQHARAAAPSLLVSPVAFWPPV